MGPDTVESSMSNSPRTVGLRRRHWLIAAPAGLLALGVAAHRFMRRGPDATSDDTALGSLRAGDVLDRWTVVRVHPLHLGAVPVVLATAEGRRYQVDVLARDPAGPPGVANTERLSLYVVNSTREGGTDGQRRTDEEQGLGAMALAQALEADASVPGLLTLQQRQRQHPRGAFGVPLT